MPADGTRTDARINEVTGGVAGLEATYAAVRALADIFDRAGSELRDWSALGARTMADPDLLESALLSPLTFAEAEAAVLAATTGPDGVLVESAGWEATAVLLGAAVTGLEATDEVQAAALRQLTLGLGIEGIAGLLALAYGDAGTSRVVPLPTTLPGSQPTDLEGLLAHLQVVAGLSPDPDSPLNGTVEVQTIADPGGTRHIVYLPGTDDIATLPTRQDHDVRDLPTDLRLMAGQANGYQDGILDAMAQAGIDPGDPVLLVGHSMGGMVAAAILSQGSRFNVTDVVTAGAPTAQVEGFPDGTRVLSLEHDADVVPTLDLAPVEDSVEQVTVEFATDAGGETVQGRHGYPAYLAGAAAVDASDDPSVRAQLASLHDHGFLGTPGAPSAGVTSQVFQVVRTP